MTQNSQGVWANRYWWFLWGFVQLSAVISQSSLSSPAQPHILSGISHLYNYRFEDALTALDSAKQIDPDHPVGPFITLATKWLKAQTESGYDVSYEVIEKEIDRLVPWYEREIKKNPENPEYPLYLGSTYGMKARIAMARQDWLGVIIFGYNGYRYVATAKKLAPQLPDIFMPIGLMEYYSSKMPRTIKFMAGILGINTDTRSGLANLERAADSSYYSWIESSNVLVYAYLYIEKDYKKALKRVIPLTTAFPDNPLFKLLRAEILAKSGNWDALEDLLPELELFTHRGPALLRNECDLKYKYVLALKAFHEADYPQVITLTSYMIDNYKMEFDWLRGFAHLLRGKAYDKMGDHSSAITDYKITASMKNMYPEVEEARLLIR